MQAPKLDIYCRYWVLYTVRIRKLWNRKTTFKQYLSVFDFVTNRLMVDYESLK